MIKGVIFDFNGTLVNDKKANEAAWYKALMKLSNGQVNFDEFYPRYTSVKDTILIAAMFDELYAHTRHLNAVIELKRAGFKWYSRKNQLLRKSTVKEKQKCLVK